MGAENIGSEDGTEQRAALARILALGQADIDAERFRDIEEFLCEMEQECLGE